MANLRQLKEKTRTITSINKITSAMELISITKSRTYVKRLMGYKEYLKTLQGIVHTAGKYQKPVETKGTTWVLFFSDLGLAGGFNSNVFKEFIQNYKDKDKVIAIGSKGKSLIESRLGKKEEFSFFKLEELKDANLRENLVVDILSDYVDDKSEVKVVYTKYNSQLSYVPTTEVVFPITEAKKVNEDLQPSETLEFEPSARVVFEEVLNIYLLSSLIGYYRESLASEHTARRVAMENASTNSEDLLKKLKIEINRTRQAKITQEILEIIGGSEALK